MKESGADEDSTLSCHISSWQIVTFIEKCFIKPENALAIPNIFLLVFVSLHKMGMLPHENPTRNRTGMDINGTMLCRQNDLNDMPSNLVVKKS